ncbi:MAG: hypothetical protein Q7K55_01690 [Candidatus Levybacteria bacterium]|nr:hypothetical protein [Candidatus Levybacteria bacterium]
MSNYRNELLEELKQQGVIEKDAEELLQTAFKLSDLSVIRRSYQFKKSFIERLQSRHSGPFRIRTFLDSGCASLTRMTFTKIFVAIFAVILFFVTFNTVASAQKSLPGDTLYPVKRLSENIVSRVNPGFKDEILLRRSEEIKDLTDKNKDHKLIKDTIDEYKNNLEKDGKLNQTKVEESKKNLEEAKEKSIEENRGEIEKILNRQKREESDENHESKRSDGNKNENEVKGERIIKNEENETNGLNNQSENKNGGDEKRGNKKNEDKNNGED